MRNIVSLRENPGERERFDSFFSSEAGSERRVFFRESIRESLQGENPLPQWYLLLDAEGNPVGGAGLCGMSALSAEPGADVRAFRVAGGWGETERRKTLIAHLKKEAAHLGFRYLACRDGEGIQPGNDGFREILEIADPGEGLVRIFRTETLPDWEFLIAAAEAKRRPRTVSPFLEAGGVAAALMTVRGRVYTGVCIDSACSLGMCAERNALASMITAGEEPVDKLVCLMPDGEPGPPCGSCREFLMQLDARNRQMKILRSRSGFRTVSLEELLPMWWGEKR